MSVVLAALLVLALAISPSALAAGQGKNDDKEKGREAAAEHLVRDVITTLERSILQDYFRHRTITDHCLPPGLAKRDDLPPGLQMQLDRWGTLPPGLDKCDLPRDLVAQLPGRAKGRKFVAVGEDVLLIDTTTRLILDVMRGVLRGK